MSVKEATGVIYVLIEMPVSSFDADLKFTARANDNGNDNVCITMHIHCSVILDETFYVNTMGSNHHWYEYILMSCIFTRPLCGTYEL